MKDCSKPDNEGKNIMEVYPDAFIDATKKGAKRTYIVPSLQMIVETDTNDNIIRELDPLNIEDDDDEEAGLPGFNEYLVNLP